MEASPKQLTLEQLRNSIHDDAAIRRKQRLQPVGGSGDKLFPPTYPGEGSSPARHVFEKRRFDGQDIRCVLLDSVQSQANRLEEALLELIAEKKIAMPYLFVDFTDQADLNDLGRISTLEAPHRIFDAIIRDSDLNGRRFAETDEYRRLCRAKPTNAVEVFRLSPTSLVFGAWHSTGESGGIGAKFARVLTSEIIGVNAVEGQKGANRIDPLGIRADVKVVNGPLDWIIATGAKGEKNKKPSKINHSNIISSLVSGGVSIDYALHTAVLSCAGLRRLRFPEVAENLAGQTVLAAIALLGLLQQDKAGYPLRSRCDLVCEGKTDFEIVHSDGATTPVSLKLETAIDLFEQSIMAAQHAGFPWDPTPLRLTPQNRLVELIARSRAMTLQGEPDMAQNEDGNS